MRSPNLRRIIANTTPIIATAAASAVVWYWPDRAIWLPLALIVTTTTHFSSVRLFAIYIAIAIASLTFYANNTVPSLTQLTPSFFEIAVLGLYAVFLCWLKHQRPIPASDLSSAFAREHTEVVITDLNGRIVSANEHLNGIFSDNEESTLGSTLASIAGDELWHSICERKTSNPTGAQVDLEFAIPRKNGEEQLYSCRVTEAGSALLVIQITDLAPAMATQEALVNAGKQMRRVFGKTSDFVLLTDTKLNIIYANDNASNALSSSFGELIQQPVYRLIQADHRRRFMKCMEQFAQRSRNEVSLADIAMADNEATPASLHIVRIGAPEQRGYAIVFSVLEQHMKALAEAKTSEARFSQIFHSTPDAILVCRASDTMILDLNDSVSRLLGYSREDVIGELESELNLWPNPTERDAVLEQVRVEHSVIDHETSLRTKNGSLVYIELSLRYMEIDGELCLLCVARDISKRLSAEAALIETEEKFGKVFSASPDGIIIVRHSDGVITDANDAVIKRGGFTRDEVIGQSIYEQPVFASAEDFEGAITEMEGAGRISNRSITLISKSGKGIPSMISATVFDLSGEAHIMVIAKDMTRQRSTEERLRSSEERFRGIFENTPIGILLVDMQGRIFQANRTAAELLAYDEQHMYGLHISRLVPADERPNLKKSLFTLTIKEKNIDKAERRMICQNGLEIWANFHVVLQHDSKGEAQYYIVQIADISDIKQGQHRMERMAFYDTLTDLVNRRLFHERLEQAIERSVRTQKAAALMYLDLDNFKRVNDTLGHQVGDHLLKEVATRLKECVRAEDTVGRTGGDEFNILLSEIGSPSDAGMVAQKILNHLREPIQVSGHPLVVTTSIGITVIPGDSQDPNELMRNADLAMYKAKERGRNNYQFYSNDLNTNAVKRLRTEYEIRQAIEQNEFELFYQPKVSLKTQQIVGVESLIRWNHPDRGMLTPDEFIEVAEDTGSIIDIGTWVIETACQACQLLSACNNEPVQVAINISPRQFRDPNLVATMKRSLRQTNLDPGNIEIEITETMLMQDVEAARMTLQRLSDLGVSLAIDDFGTGYSSLNYLKRFPINTVKVDRSFVTDLPSNADDMAITGAVIAMAHQLKMEVVAEGVETEAQLEFLAQQDCEYAQGWLFSKALPLNETLALVKANQGYIKTA